MKIKKLASLLLVCAFITVIIGTDVSARSDSAKKKIKKVLIALEKYYDTDNALFFMNTKADSLNVKIVLTAMCIENIPKLKGNSKYNLAKGIRKAYIAYDFKTEENTTFYNSGADIIYCYNVIGELDHKIINMMQKSCKIT